MLVLTFVAFLSPAPKHPRSFETSGGHQQRGGRGGPESERSDRNSGDFEDFETFAAANDMPSAASMASNGAYPDPALQGVDESSTLWMGDLEGWMTEENLTQHFSGFGEPVKVRVATFKYGIPAGYCYVYFTTPRGAQRAYETLNGRLMEGTNHVFRLKIANKNSRFFSRGKEHGNPSPSPVPVSPSPSPLPSTSRQVHSHQQQPVQHYHPQQPQHHVPFLSTNVPTQVLSHGRVPLQAPEPRAPMYARPPLPAGVAAPRDPYLEQQQLLLEHRLAQQGSPTSAGDEQTFIDDSFDMRGAFDPGVGDDFTGRSPRSPSFSVFVGNLDQEIDRETLLSAFQTKYPSVVGGKIVFDPFTGVSKGYGFVIFGDEGEQHRALREMQGQLCGDRPMRINKAVRRN